MEFLSLARSLYADSRDENECQQLLSEFSRKTESRSNRDMLSWVANSVNYYYSPDSVSRIETRRYTFRMLDNEKLKVTACSPPGLSDL